MRVRAVPVLMPLLALLAACAPPPAVPEPRPPIPVDVPPATAAPPLPRPVPEPIRVPAAYAAAVARGTRTADGRPGPGYWQQWADYRIETRVDPGARRVDGSATIVYHNRSPDVLRTLQLELTQNFHAAGVVRYEPAEVTGGKRITAVRVNGRAFRSGGGPGGWYVIGTRLVIVPEQPVQPGQRPQIAIDWSFDVPQAGAGARMGWSRDDLLYLGYWYPHMVVYDDVVGWHPDPFVGSTEFYHGFGSYDVSIEVPESWIVHATGSLQNPDEVLAEHVLTRLRRAATSDAVVHVVTADDFGRATRRAPGGRLTWHFVADSVRDFAFSVTRSSLWDAARTPVGDRTGDGATDYTTVHAVYRATAPRWRQVWRYSQHSIDFLSRFTGYPYPWPHMTAVEGGGIIGGGMEYPMMTLIGDYNQQTDTGLYAVTIHELAHMWFPMIVSTDERRYSWLDEGTTRYNQRMGMEEFYEGSVPWQADWDLYLPFAGREEEGEMMRRSAHHYSSAAFGIASYTKPGLVLRALQGLLGDATFMEAYREVIRRWAFRHAYPWDVWRTFEAVSGRDLEWFWRSWYYETWTLDHAVASVTSGPGGDARIVIEDRGDVPMPARVVVTREDGEVVRLEVPVGAWLGGARSATLAVPAGAPVTRVELDPERWFPDVDRSNNSWTR
jgi:hypothetical protein